MISPGGHLSVHRGSDQTAQSPCHSQDQPGERFCAELLLVVVSHGDHAPDLICFALPQTKPACKSDYSGTADMSQVYLTVYIPAPSLCCWCRLQKEAPRCSTLQYRKERSTQHQCLHTHLARPHIHRQLFVAHGDRRLVALDCVISGDGDLLAFLQLHRLAAFQHPRTDLGALLERMRSSVTC